jgi:hypothetical protein
MGRERIELAVRRIEAALTRVEAAARNRQVGASLAPDQALLNRHEALRQTVSASLAELDALIGVLEK